MVTEVELATVRIQAENTPVKSRYSSLAAHPRWRYIGPQCSIEFEWVIGQWKWGTFDEISDHRKTMRTQQRSDEWAEFETTLPSIYLSKLSPRDEPYMCEIWLRSTAFPDLRVLVDDCVRII